MTNAKTFPIGTKAENEPGYPIPQVQAPFNPEAPIKVDRYDAKTGEALSSREIPVVRTTPQRPAKQAAQTLLELKQSLEEIGNDVDQARENFRQNNASLTAYYGHDEQKQLRSEIADLQAKLAEKQDRLHELESKPAPRDSFYLSIKDAENKITHIARRLVETLGERAAQDKFGVSLKKLSGPSQKDVQLRYLHALESYLDHGGSYTRLTRNEQATADVIDKRAERLLNDVNDILEKEFLAEQD